MKKSLNTSIILILLSVLLGINTCYSQSENEKIAELIEQKRSHNKISKNFSTYKIQLYTGNETQAYKTKLNFDALFPEYQTKVTYKSPEWKTQVINFKTRLEADRALNLIKIQFIGAIVTEDKF
ncbi:SPOR domain-containing protein [Lutibacter sp.]|uniref:SPOR domain-containing protein n=1 Tax=Lutibacter sp. TaxID=1925666 RepID=UPI00273431CB|nr:SPOR domain-containing protein [Lutibacter sp.]MDP3312052.1 SPOR domain-containing protein [Lutibacter sp.]